MKLPTTTISIIALASTGALAMAAPASAQTTDTGLYLDGGYTYLDITPEGSDDGVDSSAITARLGYKFTPMFSLEGEISSGVDDGEFDYNVDEDEFGFDDNDDGDFDDIIAASGDIGVNYLVAAFAKAEVPVSDMVNLHGRLGYGYIDLDASVTTPGGGEINIEDSADGPAAGVGASLNFDNNWTIRGDYSYFDFDDTDTHAGTVTAGYRF